jgi:RNA polymerase sigma factor (sigma-70 family)
MSMANQTDADIVRGCLEENPLAWKYFFERFGSLIYSSITKVLGQYRVSNKKDLRDDIYQHISLHLWQQRALKQPIVQTNLKGYLAALTTSRSVDFLRTRRSYGKTHNIPKPQNILGPMEAAKRNEMESLVHHELSRLTQKEAYIMRLNSKHEMTHQQISKLLMIPIDTVSTVIRRARLKIKKSLERKGFSKHSFFGG